MKQLAYVAVGAIISALVFVAVQVQAGESQVHECAAFSVPSSKKRDKFQAPPRELPAGWTPVGGAANGDGKYVIACRQSK